jgi:hypothetical protein
MNIRTAPGLALNLLGWILRQLDDLSRILSYFSPSLQNAPP